MGPLKCDCTAAERIALVKTLDLAKLHECLAYHNEFPKYFQPSVLKAIEARIVRLEKQQKAKPRLVIYITEAGRGEIDLDVKFEPNLSVIVRANGITPTPIGQAFVKIFQALGITDNEVIQSLNESLKNAR